MLPTFRSSEPLLQKHCRDKLQGLSHLVFSKLTTVASMSCLSGMVRPALQLPVVLLRLALTPTLSPRIWGHGFYFADDVSVSQGYSRGGTSINSRYPFMKVMLLCRVLAGRVHVSQQPPSQSDQERLVADCLGPGGCFGAKSKFHCIQGGGYAYVAAHRDQVYPEFVILYQ